MHKPLFLTNSLTQKKEVFKTLKKDTVLMYVCGITPYDFAHLGHARVYVVFDVLARLLSFLGYTVTYCRNFTDIDDKLIDRAQIRLGNPNAYPHIASEFIAAFNQDVDALNCLRPTYEPRVTDHIPEIIAFIESLIKAGKAYEINGDVYFEVGTFPGYGKLSKQKLDELQAGARVEVNQKKRSPLDFALWKSEPKETFWKSPWGWGRPGWHIECSALAYRYLGPQIDIHAGGADLMFPHHENEIAQTEGCTGTPFATVWLHNAFVQINKEKMSKSLGNFFTLKDLFKKVDPMVIRFLMLNHYYRAPIDFSLDDLEGLQRAYERLCTLFSDTTPSEKSPEELMQSGIVQEIVSDLCDDLNSVAALGVIFKNSKILQINGAERADVKQFLQEILGLTLEPLKEAQVVITAEIQKLIDERESARAAKDWKRADELRAQLAQLGVTVQDKKL